MAKKSGTTQEYDLIIPAAKGSDYGGGWLCGSIEAHWYHCTKHRKVFWVCPLGSHGLGITKGSDKWKTLLKTIPSDGSAPNSVGLSGRGFFYKDKEVSWMFTLEKILTRKEVDERKSDLLAFVPPFRQEYFKTGYEQDWILMSELKLIDPPIKARPSKIIPDFVYHQDGRRKKLKVNQLQIPYFVEPVHASLRSKKPSIEESLDKYLKAFLLANPPKSKFREFAVQQAFLLGLLKKGYVAVNEGPVKEGRFDILFQRERSWYAMEFKRDKGDEAVNQLKAYIEDLKSDPEYSKSKIKGVIVCGSVSDVLRKNAEKAGFTCTQFNVTINFDML
jgi:hypothetical protein